MTEYKLPEPVGYLVEDLHFYLVQQRRTSDDVPWPNQVALCKQSDVQAAYAAGLAARVPKGWKMVPVEIDGKMWSAGRKEFHAQYCICNEASTTFGYEYFSARVDGAATEVFAAMLAAAPEPTK